ncbi:MAG: VOC family protein [Lachnospiraceae bacterium]|nr:VOC family protein [Lachnospiraceae bacterium]
MMKAGTSVIFLPCSNIRDTEAFYHDELGLPIVQRQADNLLIFDTGYGYWGFCEYADGRKPLSGPQGVCLSLNLESEEAVLEAYETYRGRCRVYREPAKHPQFPVFSFFLLDPDGYLVEFQKTGEKIS